MGRPVVAAVVVAVVAVVGMKKGERLIVRLSISGRRYNVWRLVVAVIPLPLLLVQMVTHKEEMMVVGQKMRGAVVTVGVVVVIVSAGPPQLLCLCPCPQHQSHSGGSGSCGKMIVTIFSAR